MLDLLQVSLEDTQRKFKTTFTRFCYDLKTEQNHYGKASCSHNAGMKTIWRRYEMKTELLSVWNENETLSGIVWPLVSP